MLNPFMERIRQTYRQNETESVELLLKEASFSTEALNRIQTTAAKLITDVRSRRSKQGHLDSFLHTYDLSSQEGVALMCLAEALLRVPDNDTIDKLIKDKIGNGDWESHLGKKNSIFVNAATLGLMLTGKLFKAEETSQHALSKALNAVILRLGEPFIRQAVLQAMKILGKQFVMGQTIQEAIKRAEPNEAKGYRYSYDMLGEAAKTAEDSNFYFESYKTAIQTLAQKSKDLGPLLGPGISVKLSALHPRYEWVNRERMEKELSPRLMELCLEARNANLGFTIDAEEADRLELSLILFEKLVRAPQLKDWEGLGLAVQAYQKRAPYVLDWVLDLAKQTQMRLMVRLVKGAYWDSEIKWSQERGLSGYPVFTRKSSTDVSFLACAKKLFAAKGILFPQFASHNAFSVAAVLEMAEEIKANADEFEFQCLHGMGDTLYDSIVGPENLNIPCRIYAPVGGHEHLLGYLVRRLLENGANTSFVNRILDDTLPISELIEDPVSKLLARKTIPHPQIPLPIDLYGAVRPNSLGLDLSNSLETDSLLQEINLILPDLFKSSKINAGSKTSLDFKKNSSHSLSELDNIFEKAKAGADLWEKVTLEVRGNALEKMAQLLQENHPSLMALLIREGGKTVQDASTEIRESIDYCWYYRSRLHIDFEPQVLQGPTGEYNQLSLHPRGVIACISPWNFPLAIFLGQILGALAAGNAVLAKPASQTPAIAHFAVDLLHQAGFPREVVQLVIGEGGSLGERLVNHPWVQGVMLTGSTETGRIINQNLSNRQGPIIPFIAETGGQNAMLVDSTALPEQTVSDVMSSAFNSAGQRCSALRVLFIQEEIADSFLTMLKGAMAELKIGDPLELSTDVGPVIDQKAADSLEEYILQMQREGREIYRCSLPKALPKLPRGVFFAPAAYQIEDIAQLKREVFGPILHVIYFSQKNLDKILEGIRNTGYGLTLGIQSRIQETADYILARTRVGNSYVNRNMIGAVVGVQPFGGEGLSGTGPKAGGPHILARLSVERTLSVNTAATGGNVNLMSLTD